jgi:hypothetical protein
MSPAFAALIIALPAVAAQGVIPFAPLAAMRDGTPLVIAIDALTFFFCAAVLLIVHVPSPTRTDIGAGGRIEQGLWADVRRARSSSGGGRHFCGWFPRSSSRTWPALQQALSFLCC